MSQLAPTDRTSSETADEWSRSSLCSSTSCVEVSSNGNVIRVRDSKRADSAILSFDRDEWRAFVAGVKNDEFDA